MKPFTLARRRWRKSSTLDPKWLLQPAGRICASIKLLGGRYTLQIWDTWTFGDKRTLFLGTFDTVEDAMRSGKMQVLMEGRND